MLNRSRCTIESVGPGDWSRLEAFSGYEPWLARLALESSSFAPQDLSRVLGTRVRFSMQAGKLPAGLDQSDIKGSYIDRCVQGVVPTRPNDLHDLCNALVWARFPRAKEALHRRQLRLAMSRVIPEGVQRVRTREQDSFSMLDEGGLLLGKSTRAVFGHATLLDAIAGRPLRPFLLHLPSDDLDEALAARLEDTTPLPRVRERWMLGSRGALGVTEPNDKVTESGGSLP